MYLGSRYLGCGSFKNSCPCSCITCRNYVTKGFISVQLYTTNIYVISRQRFWGGRKWLIYCSHLIYRDSGSLNVNYPFLLTLLVWMWIFIFEMNLRKEALIHVYRYIGNAKSWFLKSQHTVFFRKGGKFNFIE